jgi:hypothetical protein
MNPIADSVGWDCCDLSSIADLLGIFYPLRPSSKPLPCYNFFSPNSPILADVQQILGSSQVVSEDQEPPGLNVVNSVPPTSVTSSVKISGESGSGSVSPATNAP